MKNSVKMFELFLEWVSIGMMVTALIGIVIAAIVIFGK